MTACRSSPPTAFRTLQVGDGFVDRNQVDGFVDRNLLDLPIKNGDFPLKKDCLLGQSIYVYIYMMVWFPICEPWCWYMHSYKTGRFCGKCWCAYSSTMVRIWVSRCLQTVFRNRCFGCVQKVFLPRWNPWYPPVN